MSVPVVLRAVAQDEADEAARWYEGKRVGLGADFLAELQRVLDVISGQPDRYPLARISHRGMKRGCLWERKGCVTNPLLCSCEAAS